jgi:hypothetical protein
VTPVSVHKLIPGDIYFIPSTPWQPFKQTFVFIGYKWKGSNAKCTFLTTEAGLVCFYNNEQIYKLDLT